MNQRPNVSCCFAPFCEADSLVPSDGPGRVLVESHVRGVDHEPLHVRLVDAHFQQPFPNSRIAPTDEAAVRIAPAAVFRRQVAPGSASPCDPEDGVDEFSVVFGDSAPTSRSSGQERLDFCPHFVRKVVAVERVIRGCSVHARDFARKQKKIKQNLVTTCSSVVKCKWLSR